MNGTDDTGAILAISSLQYRVPARAKISGVNWGKLDELPFEAEVWGTVGDWVSGLASAGALLLALFILLREVRLRRQDQADKIACWLEYSEHGEAAALLRNTSDLPCFLPDVTAIPKYPWVVWWLRKRVPAMHWDRNPTHSDHRDYVKWSVKPYTEGMEVTANEKCERLLGLRYHFQYYIICIEFKDATNRRWIRNLTSGKYEGPFYKLRRSIACQRYDNSVPRPVVNPGPEEGKAPVEVHHIPPRPSPRDGEI